MELTIGVEGIASAGENLVAVGLMSHIPYDAIVGRVEHVVHGHGNLYRAQTRSEMARIVGQFVDNVAAQFITYGGQLVYTKLAKIGRRVDMLQIFKGVVLFHSLS